MKRKAARSSPPVPNSKASKPTSSQPSGNQNIIEIDSDEVNYVDMDDSDSKNPTKSQSLKRSWVWLHFKEEVGPQAENLAVCQVVQRGGKLCGASMKRDKSKSMKNLHGHLYNMHKLADPKLLKKTKKSSHIDIRTWAKKELQYQVQLNSESLKNALVYFLAKCNLSFCLIEQKSYRELVHLINKDAAPLVRQMCRSGIATHLARVCWNLVHGVGTTSCDVIGAAHTSYDVIGSGV
ncbi:hypothetical protein PGT21_035840 [Puccinia graminis f. sp. tritici]|uniref:BED-type domain-containing protein n=1 Tax=Puccinia graminis f. sp. tritici TaxID=56615 RepID=A0A5B0PMZ8_PUCGR|nr:hypothetical protein PGT21_035840 [Puccinia graminis f. sp. tritici]